jgi:hypothetical protein
MKRKLILGLALVLSGSLFGLLAPQRAYGFVAEVQLNHTNLNTHYSFLKIKTVRLNFTNDEMVAFTVLVMPKDKHQPENFHASLEVNDSSINGSHHAIVSTTVQAHQLAGGIMMEEIPKPLRGKCVVFYFSVAAKYLEASEFRVEETTGMFDSPTDYCFNLKEFAGEK